MRLHRLIIENEKTGLPGWNLNEVPSATRLSTLGGPVAFRPHLTMSLAFSMRRGGGLKQAEIQKKEVIVYSRERLHGCNSPIASHHNCK